MGMLEDVKKIKQEKDNKKEKEYTMAQEKLKNAIKQIEEIKIEKLNEMIETINFIFENEVFEINSEFLADSISHKVGFRGYYNRNKNRYDKIAIFGGGVCGDIGIVYTNNMFYITGEYGAVDMTSIKIEEKNIEEIYKKYGEKATTWIEKFIIGINRLYVEMQNKIEEEKKEI